MFSESLFLILFLKRLTERSFRISIADKARMNTIKRKLVSVVQKNKSIATKRKVIEVGSFPETLETDTSRIRSKKHEQIKSHKERIIKT